MPALMLRGDLTPSWPGTGILRLRAQDDTSGWPARESGLNTPAPGSCQIRTPLAGHSEYCARETFSGEMFGQENEILRLPAQNDRRGR